MSKSKEKLWGGRFSEKTATSVESFTSSIHFDKRLYAYDIEGSIAHCRMLAATGIITEDESFQLVDGLTRVKTAIEANRFEFKDSLEDIHMHIEHALFEDIGKVALKLHTARSRNDQIALDLRMYLRDVTVHIAEQLQGLQGILVGLARQNITVVLPGYTHLQRAQPILLSHHFMAYYEMFRRDETRFRDALKRIDVMPLGAAALAGTTYPINREYTARLLKFPEIAPNSIDAVSDRDFIVEFLAAASLCMTHFSRFSEELILWSSSEFGYIEFPDAYATGSSIMPQKKNPDIPELVRGKAGRVIGSLMGMLTILKGLPLSYNRDLQEDKELLFDAVDTLQAAIDIYIQLLPRLKIKENTMRKAASEGYLNATDMADYLAAKGMAFRDAHHCVGNAVSYALEHHKELHELSIEEFKQFADIIEPDIYPLLSLEQMIIRRNSYGGTATENVLLQIEAAERRLKTGSQV